VAPSLTDRLDLLHRLAMGVAAEFREVAKECREADYRATYQAMFRSTLMLVCAELKRVSLESGVL
jgi:hypothetical protein